MGKMKLKKLLSVALVSVLGCAALVNPAFATEQPDITLKIESSLREELENVGDDESVDVMIWFTDIDHEAEKAQIVSAFEEKIASGELPPEVIDMFHLSKDSQELDGERIKEIDSAVSTLEMQDALMTKRQISAGIYAGENQEKIDSLFEPDRITEENSFISHYSPCLVTSLTKNEIYDICGSDLVTDIYSYSEEKVEEDDPEPGSGGSNSTYTTFQYDDTGITAMRDDEDYGFTGEDIIVGVCDGYFANPENVDYFYTPDPSSYTDQERVHYNVSSQYYVNAHSAHGSLVACLIAGRYVDPENEQNVLFSGAVPDAELYLASTQSIIGDIEYLITKGANVINASMAIGDSPYNSYGKWAKWMDHVVSQHNVSMVMSAGNKDVNGITSGHYSYNTIIVGNIESSGMLRQSSSYCNLSNGMYKPDLVAPGSELYTPAFYNSGQTSNSGTSFAAPIVTGAVAQLCEASPTLAANPRLMKSIILAGSTINSYMDTDVVVYQGDTSQYEGFDRKFGSGIVNSYNSYMALTNNHILSFNYVSAVNPLPAGMSIYLTENSLLRFVDVWDVPTTMTDPHTNISNLNNVDPVQLYGITVQTPSGALRYMNTQHYDSKKIATFEADESGLYRITFYRIYNNNVASVNHGLTVSIQEPVLGTVS